MPKKSIVIFEDSAADAGKIKNRLKSELPRDVSVQIFQGKARPEVIAFEAQIKLDLQDFPPPVLFLSDRDLSGTEHYRGLSEAAVSNVAESLGIPICLYARNPIGSVLNRKRDWGDGRIILDFEAGIPELARQVGIIYGGFDLIRRKFEALKSAREGTSPAQILAAILKKPDLVDKIALYGTGDQQMLSEILPYYETGNDRLVKRRIPRILGYWLWESILRFPGVLVNEVAAASYLDINQEDFKRRDVLRLFNDAKYSGPFADSKKPLWWRASLDEILAGSGALSGRDLAEKKTRAEVRHCMCSVDPTLKAGFYCMERHLPVSAEKSRGSLSWFPAGADLARISTPVFDELAPWIGLY